MLEYMYLACMQVIKPMRDLPIGLLGSVGVVTLLYLLMSATIVLMVPYYNISTQASFANAFEVGLLSQVYWGSVQRFICVLECNAHVLTFAPLPENGPALGQVPSSRRRIRRHSDRPARWLLCRCALHDPST